MGARRIEIVGRVGGGHGTGINLDPQPRGLSISKQNIPRPKIAVPAPPPALLAPRTS